MILSIIIFSFDNFTRKSKHLLLYSFSLDKKLIFDLCCVIVQVLLLIDLGLITGTLEDVLKDHLYAEFFMHKTGHWLGLDVHDCGDYRVDGLWVEIEPNMVLTIEPGIYINEEANVPNKYKGIGIRIEDDVLITEHGPEVLTAKVPKERAEIEALVRG